MADITQINLVDIDLNSGKLHRSWLNHGIGVEDVKANGFGVRVFRNGAPVNLSGASVYGYFTNSAGVMTSITSGNSVSGNEAYVVLPAACYETPGKFTLAVKLIGGGATVTVRIVDGMVVG